MLKNCFLVLTILLVSTIWSGFAMADVYVVIAPDSTIHSLSEADDCVVPAGYSKYVIRGKDIKSLALADDTSLYLYKDNKFVLDDVKVSNKNKALQSAAIARQDREQAKVAGMAKLKALGLTEDEIKALIR